MWALRRDGGRNNKRVGLHNHRVHIIKQTTKVRVETPEYVARPVSQERLSLRIKHCRGGGGGSVGICRSLVEVGRLACAITMSSSSFFCFYFGTGVMQRQSSLSRYLQHSLRGRMYAEHDVFPVRAAIFLSIVQYAFPMPAVGRKSTLRGK